MKRYRWKLLPAIPESKAQGYSYLLTQLLVNRGITAPGAQAAFLSADERLQESSFLLPDMARAVKRLSVALNNKEKMGVYGDFDADGICGTALLVEGLRNLGARIIPYLPHRIEDGYGLNSRALQYLKEADVSLVVTVDCGITSFTEARLAQDLGMDLIITDHHRPHISKQQTANSKQQTANSKQQSANSKQQIVNSKQQSVNSRLQTPDSRLQTPDSRLSTPDSRLQTIMDLPQALAVVDPWRSDSLYPFPHLSGSGVAYKLLQAFYQARGKEESFKNILELVAMGTVADMQPLTGENHYLVKKGLEELKRTSRPGLKKLMEIAGLHPERIDSEDLSWVLGPRLNAAGRIDHAILGYNLIFSKTEAEAGEKAEELEKLNTQRQKLTQETYEKAKEQVIPGSPLIFVQGDFPQGVIGIVAGRLSREFYRPAVVLQEGKEFCHGSARSIPEFDLVKALSVFEELLERYGGHPRAAGFALAPDKVSTFRDGFIKLASEELAGLELMPSLTIEAELPLWKITGATYGELEKLEPFGQGNPRPMFLCQRATVVEDRRMGKDGEHLKLKLKDRDSPIFGAVGFNMGKELPELSRDCPVDIVYALKRDNWGGMETVRLELLDLDS